MALQNFFSPSGHWTCCCRYYKRALALEPNNCEVGKALTRLGSQMRTEKKNEKELFSRMLGVKDK